MAENIIRSLIELVVLYLILAWIVSVVLLLAHKSPALPARRLLWRAVVQTVTHPLDFVIVVYVLALRVLASFRR
jgi:hypothetical protein